ncbi:MAG: hypothetical protein K8T90_10345 [Planctomycetes bacterium]|nr:hypothetical protein [Planctomycetota bacterium]
MIAPLAHGPFGWWMSRRDPEELTASGAAMRPILIILFVWVPLILMIAIAVDFATAFPMTDRVAAASALRLGGLLAVAMFLLVRLAGEERSAGLANALAELRRDVTLGRLAPVDAIRRAELAVVGLDAASAFGPRVLRIMQRRDEIRRDAERLAAQVGPHTPSQTPGAVSGSIPLKCAHDAWDELTRLWGQQVLLRRDVAAVAAPIVVTRWMSGSAPSAPDPLVEQARRAADEAATAIEGVHKLVDEATGPLDRAGSGHEPCLGRPATGVESPSP